MWKKGEFKEAMDSLQHDIDLRKKKIVKCRKCGTEYETPFPDNFGIQMDDCPNCKDEEGGKA